MSKQRLTRKSAGSNRSAATRSRSQTAQSSNGASARLRSRLRARIESLSAERLQVADDFLAYLEERERNAATEELLAIPGFLKSFRAAEAEARKGKTVDWRSLRRDV